MNPIQTQLELSSACFRVVGHVVEAQLRFATVLTQSMMKAPFAQMRALRAAAAQPVAPLGKAAAPAPVETLAPKRRAAKAAAKETPPAAPRARRTRVPATPPAMPEPAVKG